MYGLVSIVMRLLCFIPCRLILVMQKPLVAVIVVEFVSSMTHKDKGLCENLRITSAIWYCTNMSVLSIGTPL